MANKPMSDHARAMYARTFGTANERFFRKREKDEEERFLAMLKPWHNVGGMEHTTRERWAEYRGDPNASPLEMKRFRTLVEKLTHRAAISYVDLDAHELMLDTFVRGIVKEVIRRSEDGNRLSHK